MKALFIFHRDLRLEDNNALNLLCSDPNITEIIPLFVLDPMQISNNSYRSDNAVAFMIETLVELNQRVMDKSHSNAKLLVIYGDTLSVVKSMNIPVLGWNRDYTPFSRDRDSKLSALADRVVDDDDFLLTGPATRTSDGSVYMKYTPFRNKVRKNIVTNVNAPRTSSVLATKLSNGINPNLRDELEFVTVNFSSLMRKFNVTPSPNRLLQGGRDNALKLIHKAKSELNCYKEDRDVPHLSCVSRLSAYLKFGCISVREVYYKLVKNISNSNSRELFLDQLIWRDFYYLVASTNPQILQGQLQSNQNQKQKHKHNISLKPQFDRMRWSESQKNRTAWQHGVTGFPLVDAGMRELNATGYMHNRVRMLVASFYTCDLLLPWQEAEKYFATKLIDYDPIQNNLNYQYTVWAGVNTSPYTQIINPWTQQEKFDSDCEYVKRWVQELRDLEPTVIKNWFKSSVRRTVVNVTYPAPIVEHDRQKDIFIQRLKQSFGYS